MDQYVPSQPPSTYKYHRCPECINSNAHRCTLLLRGIRSLPTEAIANGGITSEYDNNSVVEMYKRLKLFLRSYDSTAPMRVEPNDFAGAEVVPVILRRKPPQKFDARVNSVDRMLDKEYPTMFIHNFTSHDTAVCTRFELPHHVDENNIRDIPLQHIIEMGRSSIQYLDRVPQTTNRWQLPATEVQQAKSICMSMVTRPVDMYKDEGNICSLRTEDNTRAQVEGPQYSQGESWRQRYRYRSNCG